MYYTGLDPRTMEPIYVPKSAREKAMQRALIQYRNPANYDLVREALVKAGRQDLIGWDEKCLIRPIRPKKRDEDASAPRRGKGGAPAKAAKRNAPAKAAKSGRSEAGKGGAPGKSGRAESGARGPKAGNGAGKAGAFKPAKGRPAPKAQRAGKPPKANGRKGGIRKGR